MQTRDNQLLDKDSYYTKALNTTPTVTQSAFDNFYMGMSAPYVAADVLDKTYSQTPDGQGTLSAFKAAELEAQAPGQGFFHRRMNDLAYMVGSALNPITWVGGAAGEAAADVIGSTAGKFLGNTFGIMARTPLTELLPKQISRYVPDVINDQPLSTAFLGEHALKSATTGMGAMLPQGIVDNYNADTKHINWGGVAKTTGEMGALGVAIGTIPMAYGILKAKLGEALPEGEELNQAVLDKALKNGAINPDEHAWMSDFLTAKKTPGDDKLMSDLQTRATKMVGDNGLPVNTVTHESPVHIIDPHNMDALQSGLIDGGLSGLPDESKSALADFVVHNSVDTLGENTKAIDGIRGYLEMTKEKLDAREEKTAQADEILDNHLTKNMSDNMALSQKSLLRTMNKFGLESSHVDNLPMTVPDNIKTIAKKQEKINKLKNKIKKLTLKVSSDKDISVHEEMYRNELKYIDIHYPNETEKSGNIILSPYKDGVKIDQSYIPTKFKGKGLGKSLYKKAIDYALEKRLKFYSDTTLSREAQNIYRSLIRNGYKFKENQHFDVNEEGKRFSKNNEPLFTLISAPREVKPNRQTQRRIDELEASKPKTLTPKEEIQHLRSKLLGKGLDRNFQRSKEYQRLMDLSNFWPNAHVLLDRVHMEDEYNRQSALHGFLSDVVRTADGNLPQLARPENVMDYLRRRIEEKIFPTRNDASLQAEVKEYADVPPNSEDILNNYERDFSKTDAVEAKNNFMNAKRKIEEFKKKESVFKTLISCVAGALHGQE